MYLGPETRRLQDFFFEIFSALKYIHDVMAPSHNFFIPGKTHSSTPLEGAKVIESSVGNGRCSVPCRVANHLN